MNGTITIKRTKRNGYTRTYAGEVHVCCHRVGFSYDVTGLRGIDAYELSLECEAEERAQACIIEGYWSGELNCLVDGEKEIRGWWQIETN